MQYADMVSQTTKGVVTTRPARTEDVKFIYEFICDLKGESLDYDRFKGLYENLFGSGNLYFVAVADNRLVGYVGCYGQILLHRMGKVFEIQELFVHETFRSKGVGRILVTAVEEAIRSENYKSLEVAANLKRTGAHKFYIKCGFSQTHFKFTKRRPE